MTRALLAAGARRVVAIERDQRCLAALGELAAAYPGRLELVAGDALALDPAEFSDPPRKIVANLPYNIATPLLLGWLDRIAEYESLTLMFQREVAERLTAQPRTKSYGRLSVLVQWVAAPQILFDVPARAFVPPPKVTSSGRSASGRFRWIRVRIRSRSPRSHANCAKFMSAAYNSASTRVRPTACLACTNS